MCTANIILTCPLHTVAGDAEAARHIAGEYVRKCASRALLYITGQSGETCEGLPFAPQFRTETVYDLSIRGWILFLGWPDKSFERAFKLFRSTAVSPQYLCDFQCIRHKVVDTRIDTKTTPQQTGEYTIRYCSWYETVHPWISTHSKGKALTFVINWQMKASSLLSNVESNELSFSFRGWGFTKL